MICLMPLKDGHKIPHEVYAALAGQTIAIDILCLTRPRYEDDRVQTPDGSYVSHGYKSQAMCRNLLINSLSTSDEYVMMMDSDIVLTNPTAIGACVSYLTHNPSVGSVHLDVKKYEDKLPGHIAIACVVARRKLLQKITIESEPNWCNCYSFVRGIQAQAFECRYLPLDEKAGFEIEGLYDAS